MPIGTGWPTQVDETGGNAARSKRVSRVLASSVGRTALAATVLLAGVAGVTAAFGRFSGEPSFAPKGRFGCTIFWTGAGDDNRWENPVNWTERRLPGRHDRACLGPGTDVKISTDVTIGSVHGEGRIRAGTLHLDPGVKLDVKNLSIGNR
jgi:hypothetical protein